MKKLVTKLISILLAVVMVANTLPAYSLAADVELNAEAGAVESEEAVDTTVESAEQSTAQELTEERTEYTKKFRLDNGLHMAAVYAYPVHYEKDGEWKEIDNTLKTGKRGTEEVYKNTAGVWDVRFPKKMDSDDKISIEKDGYTLAFGLDGELNQEVLDNQETSLELESKAAKTEASSAQEEGTTVQAEEAGQKNEAEQGERTATYTLRGKKETFSVKEAKSATAEVQKVDVQKQKKEVEYEEMVVEKLASGLLYENVYDKTNIRYELNSNRVKESIVIKEYSDTLSGYCYTLETGKMIPVLKEDGQIEFYDENKKNIIMVMPAPFLMDDNQEYNYDIEVDINGSDGTYTMSYLLPEEWLANENRAWPVVLDPIVTADLDIDNIIDRTVAQNFTYSETAGSMECGYRSGRGLERFFLQYGEIPALKGSEIVVEACVTLYKPDPSTGSPVVEVHKVNSGWHSGTITWANQPTHNPLVEDYCVVTSAGYFSWDVTDIVRGWYTNGNTGMMFSVPASVEAVASTSWEQFYSSDYSEYYNLKPTLFISYRHNNGIEPYYSYQTMSAGHAGTAYLADSTGQLKVVKQIAEYSSTVNPFSMNLVYNSDYFASNASVSDTIQSTHGIDMLFGKGFTLDIIQTLQIANLTNAYGSYLVHHDGDGTDHYFAKQSDGTYKDEDGLGLTISGNSSEYIMSDDKGNTWKFSHGILTEIADEVGNKIWIEIFRSSVGIWLHNIYQQNKGGQSIRVASVTYISGTSYIDTLTDAAGRVYKFTYTNGKLTQISMDGAPIAQYDYSGNRLIGMKDLESSYQLWFTYSGGKVTKFQEWIDNSPGAVVEVEYKNESTMYLDYGEDRTKGTADDTKTYYACDYAGRTVNASALNSRGQVVGATNAVYSGTGATSNVRLNNRTTSTANVGVAGQNLLENGSFESGLTGWTAVGVENVANSYIRTDTYAGMQHSGKYSLLGYIPANSTGTIGAYTTKGLLGGRTYSFSGYINTKYVVKYDNWSIYLKVEAPDGTVWYSDNLEYHMDDKWSRPSVTFTTNTTGVYKLGVYCTDGYEWFYADDFQLEWGDAPTRENLIYNGDVYELEKGWLLQGTAGYGSDGVNCYLRLLGSPSTNTCAWQDIIVNLPGTETYVLSGWAWADSVADNVDTASDHAQDETKRFGLQAILTYTDGTKEYHYVPFCPDVSSWQYASLTIVPKQPTKTVKMIQPVCAYEKNCNAAWFDDISLVREAAQTMRYDSEGNLVSVTTSNLKEQTSVYSNGNLITAHTGGSGTYSYTYDSIYKHRLTSVTDTVVKQSLTYDNYGNVKSTTLQKSNGGNTLSTSATYSSDGNRLTSVTDANGNTVSYEYSGNLSTALGLATTVTDPKNVKNNYVYDMYGRLIKNSLENTSEIEYDYDKGNLSSITRTGSDENAQVYQFAYDIWGNRTSVSVGEKQLASYTYKDKNGSLSSMSYGNGDGISYTHDEFGRIKKATYSDGRVLSYTYTNEGELYSIHDSSAEQTWYYNYDSLDRIHDFHTDGIYGYFNYDAYNRMTKRHYVSRELGRGTETYTYDADSSNWVSDGLLIGMQMTDSHTISYTYDEFQRVTQKHIYSERSGGGFWETLVYRANSTAGTSTSEISERRNWIDNAILAHWFHYTYDANGNILTETDSVNNTSITYTYDNQNQLLTATYGDDRTETYTYDTAGNLLTFNNGITSHTYTYSNEDWKDLLTAVDGVTLTYDEIGNPLTYHNGSTYTMTWAEGRRLESVTLGEDTTTYEYDYNGYRTKKVNADGSYAKYYIVDGRTVGEVQFNADNTIELYMRYTYDESGSVIGFSLWNEGDTDWTHYYFMRNLQGDVLQIYNGSTNALVAEYTYDSWGNVLSETGELAELNPFRYRGYYYDEETGFYYVSSRYYDPGVGRFISADGAISGVGGDIRGYNLYSYCMNNPVNMSDPDGNWPKWVTNIGNAVKKVVNKVVSKVKPVASSVKSSIRNAAKGKPNSLPTKGQPGSSQTLNNPDGSPKQKRWYGPDGAPERDRDYNHTGDMPFPHDHVWDNGRRGKEHLPPSPDYAFSLEPLLGTALVGVCTIGIAAVALDDLTGIGVADNGLMVPLSAGVGKGLVMLFP